MSKVVLVRPLGSLIPEPMLAAPAAAAAFPLLNVEADSIRGSWRARKALCLRACYGGMPARREWLQYKGACGIVDLGR